jgi:hypothetical protein
VDALLAQTTEFVNPLLWDVNDRQSTLLGWVPEADCSAKRHRLHGATQSRVPGCVNHRRFGNFDRPQVAGAVKDPEREYRADSGRPGTDEVDSPGGGL